MRRHIEEWAELVFAVIREAALEGRAITQKNIASALDCRTVMTVHRAIRLLRKRGDVVIDHANNAFVYRLPKEGISTAARVLHGAEKGHLLASFQPSGKNKLLDAFTVEKRRPLRKCMNFSRCHNRFYSDGPQHRLCNQCRRSDIDAGVYRVMRP